MFSNIDEQNVILFKLLITFYYKIDEVGRVVFYSGTNR